MSGPYGVTPAGFVLKPVTVIQAEIIADLLGLVDPDTDTSPDQPLGQLIGILAAKLAEVWELAQVGYNATNRGDAEDALLDNIGALTGTIREREFPSTVPCTAQFTTAGTYLAGALVAYIAATPSARFTNVQQIVVPALGGDGSNPIGTGNPWPANDSGITFLFKSLSDGPAAGEALIGANTIAGHSGSLSVKVPVSGWLNVADVGNVSLGSLEEEDGAYRVRQVNDLAAPGNDTLDATRAAILIALQNASTPVPEASVQMYENTTLHLDPLTGVPAKSYLAVVYDGPIPDTDTNNPLIAKAIWANKPAGIQPIGTTSYPTPDATGTLRTVSWTRPTLKTTYFVLTVAVDASMSPTERNGLKDLVVTAIAAASQGRPFTLYGSTFSPQAGALTTLAPGKDVVANAFRSIAQGQSGVIDIPSFTLGFAPTPVGTANLHVNIGEVALVPGDLTHIAVTVIDFAP